MEGRHHHVTALCVFLILPWAESLWKFVAQQVRDPRELNVWFSDGYGIVVVGITPCADTQGQAEESSDHPLMAGHRTKTTLLDTYSGIVRSDGKDFLREYQIACIYDIRFVFQSTRS